MKTLIIEDEVMAAQSLQKLLGEVSPGVEVVAVLQSVDESVEWFEENEMPDLAFVDIHLADGSAFAIFEKVDVTCPVIFTTTMAVTTPLLTRTLRRSSKVSLKSLSKRCNPKGLHLFLFDLIVLPNKHA